MRNRQSIEARLLALEKFAPNYIIAEWESTEGESRAAAVVDVLESDGTIKKGFEGFEFVRVIAGNRAKDTDRIFKHIGGAE